MVLNYKIIKKKNFLKFINNEYDLNKIILLKRQNKKNTKLFKKEFFKNYSQNCQDLFALSALNFKKKGYFCEIGAHDGIEISNTYLLEKSFYWKGVAIEPVKKSFDKLKKNRKCFVGNYVIHGKDNENTVKKVNFYENKNRVYSSLKKTKNSKKVYRVDSCNINYVLNKNKIKKLDYLSIDTEGNELEILKVLDFKKFKPKVITIEHNFDTKKRKGIFSFLKQNLYDRVHEDISLFDDWYVKKNTNK